MSSTPISHSRPGDPDSPRRRRALLAAAAAPVIATLPDRSAFAFASASQCVMASHNASRDGTVPERTLAENWPDKWVSVHARAAELVCPGGNTGWVLEIPSGSGEWYRPGTGEKIKNPAAVIGVCTVLRTEETRVLAIYQGDFTANPDYPTGVHYVGFWPQAKLEDDPGYMGITGTCLCSVDPQLSPGSLS